jgi:hypothetical protein
MLTDLVGRPNPKVIAPKAFGVALSALIRHFSLRKVRRL